MRNWFQKAFAFLLVVTLPAAVQATSVFNQNLHMVSEYIKSEYLINKTSLIDDKVYIEPSMIYVSSNQIYLKIADQLLLPIQDLSCNSAGIFVSLKDFETGARRRVWICPKQSCRYENLDGVNYCGLCGTYRYDNQQE